MELKFIPREHFVSQKNTMKTYTLSGVLRGTFDIFRTNVGEDIPKRQVPLSFNSSGKSTHYGWSVFRSLESLFPGVWKKSFGRTRPDLDNTNKNGVGLVWYLDGSDTITLKHLLPKVSSFAISGVEKKETEQGQLWIQKPSHPYIGSGKFISVSNNYQDLINSRPKEYVMSATMKFSIDNWVIQPLVTPKLWFGGRKFDCRFYGIIFTVNGSVFAKAFKYGIARVCVNKYDPVNDPMSAITNISIQDGLEGFDESKNVPLIYDDTGIVNDMLTEVVTKTEFTVTEKLQMLILGFDVMFDSEGKPKLIEVNHEPYIELEKQNSEGLCTTKFVEYVFGKLIPMMIDTVRDASSRKIEVPEDSNWTPTIRV